MKNSDLAAKMRELFAELRGLDPAQELDLLEGRLTTETDTAFAEQIRITMAKLLADLGRVNEAIPILEDCSRSPHANEGPAYFAAEILVDCHRYSKAERFLQEAERKMVQGGSDYYKRCIFLLRAYCFAKMGDMSHARQSLAMVSDQEEELFWLRTRPVISIAAVEDLINEAETKER